MADNPNSIAPTPPNPVNDWVEMVVGQVRNTRATCGEVFWYVNDACVVWLGPDQSLMTRHHCPITFLSQTTRDQFRAYLTDRLIKAF
jgi:hypothetical protein